MTFELHRTLVWYIFVCFVIIREDLISSFAGYFKNSIIVINIIIHIIVTRLFSFLIILSKITHVLKFINYYYL